MAVRIARLKRRAEFLRVAGTRRKWVTPGLILQAADSGTEGDFRIGYTASRKVGAAVARNRARRRLRAVVDRVMPTRARPGTDYVVIARRATVARPFDALVGDMEEAFDRLAAKHQRATERGQGKAAT
jgi:ribonuclease P protein component